MHRYIIVLFLCFGLTHTAGGQARDFIFRHLSTKDGLASDITKFIFQDSRGIYWIGNDNGLQKFDGKHFTSLSFNNRYLLSEVLDDKPPRPLEDKAGNVYIGNQGGLYVYHPDGRRDTVQLHDESGQRAATIFAFCRDADDNIWIASGSNLYRYDKNSNRCIHWMSTGNWKIAGSVIGLLYDAVNHCLWLAKDNNIFRINSGKKELIAAFDRDDAGEANLPASYSFTDFYMDSGGNIWFGAWNGFAYRYNSQTGKKEMFDAFNKNTLSGTNNKIIPVCFAEDKQKNIWIGCINGGLFVYDSHTGIISAVKSDNHLPYGFHYNFDVSPLYTDQEGNVWAGTDKGINICNPSRQNFRVVDESVLGPQFSKLNPTYVLQGSNGDIYVASWGKGWVLFNKELKLKAHFYSTEYANNKEDNRKNYAWCFAEDPGGNIWIGYQFGLIGIYDPRSGLMRYKNVRAFGQKTVRSMLCDSTGNIWFGLHSGNLGKWDAAAKSFSVYEHPVQKGVNNYSITGLFSQGGRNIWMSSGGNGLSCFDTETKQFTAGFSDDGDNYFDDFINRLTRFSDTVIGVCGKFKGLSYFNPRTRVLVPAVTLQNPALQNVSGVARDRQLNTWVATRRGLFRRNEASGKMISFGEEDGLLLHRFKGNIAVLKDGRMVVPDETGLVVFSPDSINSLPPPPSALITGFRVHNQSLSVDSLLAAGPQIMLYHTQNFLTIRYASISFIERNAISYFYRLDGLDRDWVDAAGQQEAGYTNLPAGKYLFRVKSINRDGLTTISPVLLNIVILPPWWASWWARSLYVLISCGIVGIVYQARIKGMKKSQEVQLATMIATQEAERKRISRDLHDDVGTRLSALKLLLSSVREKAQDAGSVEIERLAGSAERFVTGTIKDVRGLLLNLSPAILEDFGYTVATRALVSKINEANKVYFDLNIFNLDQRLKPTDELALYRITQELINNVLKHAEAQNVSLAAGRRDGKIVLMIEDDGKGFMPSPGAAGYGLHNLDARVKLLGGTMVIDSQPGRGTAVLIEIPDTNY